MISLKDIFEYQIKTFHKKCFSEYLMNSLRIETTSAPPCDSLFAMRVHLCGAPAHETINLLDTVDRTTPLLYSDPEQEAGIAIGVC